MRILPTIGRLVLYPVLLLGLVLALLSVYLQSPDFERLLARQILERLEEALGVPVRLSALRLDLLGGRIALSGLVIESAEAGLPEPVVIDSLLVGIESIDFLEGRLGISRILVFEPVVNLEITRDGRTNLPRIDRPPQGPSPLVVENVDVFDGRFRFRGQDIGWSMSSGRIDLDGSRTGAGSFAGKADLRNLRLDLGGERGIGGNLKLVFGVEGGVLAGSAWLTGREGTFVRAPRFAYGLDTGYASADFSLRLETGDYRILDGHRIEGPVEASGTLAFDEEGLRLQAKAEAAYLLVDDLEIGGAGAKIKYEGGGIRADELEASLAGGRLDGWVEIDDLTSDPHVVGVVSFEGFELRRLLEIAELEDLRLGGGLKGSLEFDAPVLSLETGRYSAQVISQPDAAAIRRYRNAVSLIEPGMRALPSPVVLPIAAELGLEFAAGKLSIRQGSTFSTPYAGFGVSGSVEPGRLALSLRTPTLRSAEAAMLLVNLDGFVSRVLGVEGVALPAALELSRLQFEGPIQVILSGSFDAPAAQVRARSTSFVYQGRDFGSVQLRCAYSAGGLEIEQLRLRDNTSTVLVSGSLHTGESALSGDLAIEVSEFDLEGVEELAGLEPAGLAGRLSGDLKLSIGPALGGEGGFSARNLQVGPLRLQSASASLKIGERWSFSNVQVVGPGGESITGYLEFAPETMDWKAALQVRGAEIAPYAELAGLRGLAVSGVADIELDAGGRKLAAEGILNLDVKDLQVAGAALGDLSGRIRSDSRSATLVFSDGETAFQVGAQLSESGDELTIRLQDEMVDLSQLVQHFLPDQRLYVTVSEGGFAKLRLDRDTGFEGEVELGRVDVGLERLVIASDGPLRLKFYGSHLEIVRLVVTQGDDKTEELSVGGWIELTEGGRLGLNVEGHVDLVGLGDFFEELIFGGGGHLNLRARGSFESPWVSGALQLEGGFLRHKETNLAFSGIEGTFRLDGSRVTASRVTAFLAEGLVELNGYADVDLVNLAPTYFQFNLDGSSMRFELPQELEAVMGTSLIFRGTPADSILAGNIEIDRALYTKRLDLETELLRLREQQQQGPIPEELRSVRLDLGIKGERNILINNNLANMELLLDLHLGGTLAEPVLTGRAEVVEGEVFYRDRKYTINTGVIDFVNPYQLEPRFDFRAETQVKRYRIFLEFHGTPDRLFPELSSDPPESDIDILHLLAIGKVRDNPFISDTEAVQQQLLGLGLSGFLTKQVTGEVERRAERLFGIDRFRIDPFFIGDSADLTARVTVGEQVTDRLSVVYSRNISNTSEQVMVVEYRLSPSMVLVASREEDGSYGLDLHMQHRFR